MGGYNGFTKLHALLILANVTLCNCVEWNGPVSTRAVERSSTGITQTPKQAILRRQTSALSICGFESGQAQSTIACDAGSTCGVSTLTALPGPSLVQGCCAATGSLSVASCLYYTGCADYSATVTGDPNILTCTSNDPYCQSFTYPELDAISYECGSISDTTWRTVSLTFNPSAASTTSTTTSPSASATVSSTALSTASSTALSSSTPPSSSGSVQDLTPGQKVGIGTGCGCAFLLITWGIILRIRRQKRRQNHPSPVKSDEKSPADQVVKVQGRESVMEEISSQ